MCTNFFQFWEASGTPGHDPGRQESVEDSIFLLSWLILGLHAVLAEKGPE